MRNFIKIVEDARQSRYERVVQLIDDQDGRFAYPEEDDTDGIWPELVNIAIREAEQQAQQGSLRVCRVMRLGDDEIAALVAGQPLGLHWSEYESLDTSNLNVANPNVLFIGRTSAPVLVEPTAAQNYLFPDEHEICFQPGGDIVIDGIFDLASRAPLRQDLWGKPFKIAGADADERNQTSE